MGISIEKAVVSRLTFSGQRFEIIVDPEKALDFKRGEKVDMRDVLACLDIFKDARSAERVAEQDMQKAFGTTDISKVAERIVRQGQLQLTTEQRREMVIKRKAQITDIISKRGIDPQTNTPHPPARILSAMEKTGIKIDPFADVESQVKEILDKIKVILPIRFQMVTIWVKVPPQYSGKLYSVLKGCGTARNEKWLNDGSLQAEFTIMAGMQEEFFEKVSGLAHGDFESKVVRREDV